MKYKERSMREKVDQEIKELQGRAGERGYLVIGGRKTSNGVELGQRQRERVPCLLARIANEVMVTFTVSRMVQNKDSLMT